MATNLVFSNVRALVIICNKQNSGLKQIAEEMLRENEQVNKKRVYFMGTSIKLELLTFSLHLKSIFDVEEVLQMEIPFERANRIEAK